MTTQTTPSKRPIPRSTELNDSYKINKKELSGMNIDKRLYRLIVFLYLEKYVLSMLYNGTKSRLGSLGSFYIKKKKMIINNDMSKRQRLTFYDFKLGKLLEVVTDFTYKISFERSKDYNPNLIFKSNRFINRALYDLILDINSFKKNDNFKYYRHVNTNRKNK